MNKTHDFPPGAIRVVTRHPAGLQSIQYLNATAQQVDGFLVINHADTDRNGVATGRVMTSKVPLVNVAQVMDGPPETKQ